MVNSVLELGRARHRRTLDKVGGISTIIGTESTFVGVLRGNDNVVVLGRVEGECDLNGTLLLEEPGCFEGNIVAENVIIAGEVRGNVMARAKLEIASSARITGDVSGEVIAIAEGASIDGQMRTASSEPVKQFTEKRGQTALISAEEG